MVKVIGILGDIGSGKTFIAKQFDCPVFNADNEVNKIYKKNRSCFNKLKNKLPKYIKTYPINKIEISNAILKNNKNLKKIVSVVHPLVRKEMNLFLKKNIKKKMVVLDIPLLIENKLYKKNDILIFVQSKKLDILKRLRKRENFNQKLFNKFKKIQLPLAYKKKNLDLLLETILQTNQFEMI